jgi:Glycosyl hydrolases family 2, sugar binding domain/Glycosyl hydrolases family 2, TIM barrel domain/Glycosyl hydrolases family 2
VAEGRVRAARARTIAPHPPLRGTFSLKEKVSEVTVPMVASQARFWDHGEKILPAGCPYDDGIVSCAPASHGDITLMNSICRMVTLVAALCGAVAGEEPANWKPAKGPLATHWAEQVDPRNVHAEYPRPQMVRPDWVNLNGLWEYAIRSKDGTPPTTFDGTILVPFPVESALSGVMKPVKPDQRLWYRRSFELDSRKEDQRWLLHFGAVDWDASVFVNGRKLGEHKGGYDPFTFDVTDALVPGARQDIVVSVWDPTDQGSQPRGKQVLKPGGIMYTANTGIWQTVWLEPVPVLRIESVNIVPDVDDSEVQLSVGLSGVKAETQIVARAFDGERQVAEARGRPGIAFALKIPQPKLWSPDAPFLYGLRVSINGGDEVKSYFGMRKIAVAKDESGINRLFLNGKALFQIGPLDQGWWPDGLYTAPTDDALKYDIQITKKLGFNMIRKHVKVEPDRWYYWCDTMGILVWQDMPSGDNKDDAAKQQFAVELERMIDARRNHPCIVMWVPFNEGWGQHDTPRVVEWIKKHDPTRLVNNASGWTDKGVGDVSDMHNYPGPGMPPTEKNRAAVLGEFGGLGLPLQGHLWVDNKKNWGYRTFKDRQSLFNAYSGLISRLGGLEVMGLSAAVYTQTTDCEVEVNGLMTYDRAVIKLPVERVAQAHKRLFGPLPTIKVLFPTAETSPQLWNYTTHAPGFEWMKPEFDDSAWPTGDSGFGTKGTPGALVHTEWKTGDIWLRRSFELESKPAGWLNLLIHHDEDAEVFVNGKQVAALKGHTSSYELVRLGSDVTSAFKPGKNILAVHCHQTGGGQYIDVGLVDFVEKPKSNSGPALGPTEVVP